MRGIVDKVILLFFCLVLLLTTTPTILPIILLLCVFISLTVDELVSSLPFSYGLFGIGVLLSIFFPDVLFFLPVLCYPLCVKRPTPVLLLSIVPVIQAFFVFDNPATCFLILFLLSVALLLSYRERQLSKTSSDLIRLRDSDTEEKLSLQEKAQTLIENQDAGIKIATLQERTRIAREIHDNVGHLLSRSILQVGAMLTVKKEDESLLLLKESLDAAMQGIRSSVHDLRDDALDLETSAKQLLADYTSYRTHFEYDIAPELPVAVTYCFLTITKEALANITKHSNADTIRISMKEYTSLYCLSISDNGTDIHVPENSTGMGLENMQARVSALKGTIRFSTQNGFHIFVSIPKEHN
ncbi:MAG: two-component sensor histidine kinase [Lachnospiraceae bacterium]|nr:two-component sensor histidine kinase [Lachnospiraceae bacterium]